ncbi:patatin-like phospholipase family protein [Limibaculum sp. M0105]|uniref:Patatin-like phospholipase family protein n=1 Tax=Thermohalobaculum xanthum TaxID=2753746 RepID=A0A8J7M8F0_9RHOB|nr:patatin-like phospholipase family protein [Thermohalobaculum xanthum]MBK0399832.1 patatin-like phospholipase family protein [Thermohalobaculum xanthum]
MAEGSGARRATAFASLLLMALVLSACTTVLVRKGVPEDKIDEAAPYGIEGVTIRAWGDNVGEDRREAIVKAAIARARLARATDIAEGRPIADVSIAFSGGGPDGAFGAGLLRGWTDKGDRPEFSTVTGISTGAIVGLFAFLGPDYDDELEAIYTSYTTDQLLTPAIFAALLGGTAVTDTSGYRRLIESYVDDAVVAQLAEQSARGRTLLIGTTNLDASRPVVWNITGIAASGSPDAKRLIQDVIQASSAIPAAFPPVLIPVVTPDGTRYDEMHVDGGATQQVMLLPPELSLREVDRALGARVDRTVYVVMNNKLKKPYEIVRPRVLSIAGTAASSLLGGAGTGDIYKIYAVAQRDGIKLKVTWIPRDFDLEPEEAFDPVYMRALYDLGYERGKAGDLWSPVPPDFAPGLEGAINSVEAGSRSASARARASATSPGTPGG